ncbi:MAG: metallopeptidase TldD-related protein [Myxococcota bacterium]|nr:metallopeptidase TldD-related protein [Myxococcota bacterium]
MSRSPLLDGDACAAMARRVLECATDAGASDAEVLVRSQRTTRMSSRAGEGSGPHVTTEVLVRTYLPDGGVGKATGSVSGPTAAEALVTPALARARSARASKTGVVPERYDIPTSGLGLWDFRLEHITDEDRQEVVDNNDEGCRSAGSEVRCSAFVYDEKVTHRAYVASTGADAQESGTHYRLEGSAFLARDPGVCLTEVKESRLFADVGSVPMGVSLGRRLLSLKRKGRAPAGPLPLVLAPRVIAGILEHLAPAFDARLIQAGKSFLKDHLGTLIASPRVHLTDDAIMTGGLKARAFDGFGIPPIAIHLLREGVADQTYQAPEIAQTRGGRPTGHVDWDGSLWTGNLTLRPGKRSRNMIFAEMQKYLEVVDVDDFSGVNLSTGRLSLPARTIVAQGGQTEGHLGKIQLECSISELLSAVKELGNDQARYRNVDASTVVLEGIDLGLGGK